DHDFGTSTFSCLKMTFPASSVISAVRRSHSSWSNGLILGSLNTRSTFRHSLASVCLGLGVRTPEAVVGRRGCERRAIACSVVFIMFGVDCDPPEISMTDLNEIPGKTGFKFANF